MKKILLHLLLCFLIMPALHAQKGSFAVGIGPSFPLGKLGSHDLNKPGSGFARTGQHIALSYIQSPQKPFSLAIGLQFQRNGIHTTAIENGFASAPITTGVFTSSSPNMQVPPGSYTTYPNWHFKKRSWLAGALLAGAQYQPHVASKQVQPFITLQAGLQYVVLPSINGSSITDTTTAYVKQNSRSGTGLAYQSMAGVRIALKSKSFISLALAYNGSSNIRFNRVRTQTTTTRGNPGDLSSYSISQANYTRAVTQAWSSLNFTVAWGVNW